MSKFIVDSNFFIQAHRSIYPLDVVQSFWLKVKILSQNGTIVSIDKVKKRYSIIHPTKTNLNYGVKQIYQTIFLLTLTLF